MADSGDETRVVPSHWRTFSLIFLGVTRDLMIDA
jgi:hypothetical protein